MPKKKDTKPHPIIDLEEQLAPGRVELDPIDLDVPPSENVSPELAARPELDELDELDALDRDEPERWGESWDAEVIYGAHVELSPTGTWEVYLDGRELGDARRLLKRGEAIDQDSARADVRRRLPTMGFPAS
jgi:hypothetical protein